MLRNAQQCVSDGKATVELPMRFERIYETEIYKEWPKAGGGTFNTFLEAVTARQPYGLGIGQHREWVGVDNLMAVSARHKKLRLALMPLICEKAKPIAEHGGVREQVDRVKSSAGGNSAEYLLGRLKRDHPDIVERLANGELTSIKRAAIKAGIIKVPSDKDRCPIQRIKMYWKRANATQRKDFLKWLKTAEGRL